MELPACTLYSHHLRMIERLIALGDDGRLPPGVVSRWTVEIGGVESAAKTVDGLLVSVPDPRARIDAIRYRATTYHTDEQGRIEREYPPWDETEVDVDERGGRVSHEVYASGENIDEQMAWVERQVAAVCEHCPPTRDGVAALWDRPVPWRRQAWDSVREPANVGRAVWAISGGVVGAAVTRAIT